MVIRTGVSCPMLLLTWLLIPFLLGTSVLRKPSNSRRSPIRLASNRFSTKTPSSLIPLTAGKRPINTRIIIDKPINLDKAQLVAKYLASSHGGIFNVHIYDQPSEAVFSTYDSENAPSDRGMTVISTTTKYSNPLYRLDLASTTKTALGYYLMEANVPAVRVFSSPNPDLYRNRVIALVGIVMVILAYIYLP